MFCARKALLRAEDTNSFHPDHLKIKDDIAQISDMNEAALLSVRGVWDLWRAECAMIVLYAMGSNLGVIGVQISVSLGCMYSCKESLFVLHALCFVTLVSLVCLYV